MGCSIYNASELWMHSWCSLNIVDTIFFGLMAYWQSPGFHVIEVTNVIIMVLSLYVLRIPYNFNCTIVLSIVNWIYHFPDVTVHSTVLFAVNLILAVCFFEQIWEKKIPCLISQLIDAKPIVRVAIGLFWLCTSFSKCNTSFLITDGQSCGTMLPALMFIEVVPTKLFTTVIIPLLKVFGPVIVILTEGIIGLLYILFPVVGEVITTIVQGMFLLLRMPVGVAIFTWIGWEICALGDIQTLAIIQQKTPDRLKVFLPYWYLISVIGSIINHLLGVICCFIILVTYLYFRWYSRKHIRSSEVILSNVSSMRLLTLIFISMIWISPFIGIHSIGPVVFSNLQINCHYSNHLLIPPVCLFNVGKINIKILAGNHTYTTVDPLCYAPLNSRIIKVFKKVGLPGAVWIHGYLSNNNHRCGFDECNFKPFAITKFELIRSLSYRPKWNWYIDIEDNGIKKRLEYNVQTHELICIFTNSSRCNIEEYTQISIFHKLIKVRQHMFNHKYLCID